MTINPYSIRTAGWLEYLGHPIYNVQMLEQLNFTNKMARPVFEKRNNENIKTIRVEHAGLYTSMPSFLGHERLHFNPNPTKTNKSDNSIDHKGAGIINYETLIIGINRTIWSKKRRSNPKTPQRQTEKTANKNHQTVFELVGWVQQTICCGVVFRGPHGEDFIHQHDGPCMYNNKNTTNGLFANIPFVDEGHDSQHDIPDTGCSTPQTTDQDDSDQEGVNVQINGNKTDVEFENPPETDQSLPSNQEDTTNIVLNSHDI
ncbi:hypothetical protein RF11_13712 [Thelohanellus kitauei]|uniref:Uncharacterized protein n=1 Tax=Thelohanellus kitauei TaxID=669202 RepID=A0A0C2ILH1_THEKT|nr:hypothetical protein RF11_13712 [Thelohanellus kitauei]